LDGLSVTTEVVSGTCSQLPCGLLGLAILSLLIPPSRHASTSFQHEVLIPPKSTAFTSWPSLFSDGLGRYPCQELRLHRLPITSKPKIMPGRPSLGSILLSYILTNLFRDQSLNAARLPLPEASIRGKVLSIETCVSGSIAHTTRSFPNMT